MTPDPLAVSFQTEPRQCDRTTLAATATSSTTATSFCFARSFAPASSAFSRRHSERRAPVCLGTQSADLELAQYLARLPEIQRTVITLYYLQEKRVDEVARMLGMPEGTVKSYLHRARLALGEMMKE